MTAGWLRRVTFRGAGLCELCVADMDAGVPFRWSRAAARYWHIVGTHAP